MEAAAGAARPGGCQINIEASAGVAASLVTALSAAGLRSGW
jgi:hypothetical protein